MKPQGFISDVDFDKNIGFISDADFEQNIGFADATPQNSVSIGGIPLQLFQPKLSRNPVVAGIQQLGTGVGKGAAETIRQVGGLGTSIQRGINRVTGANLPVSTAFDESGQLDQATTPEGALQKAGYVAETAAELINPVGGKVAAETARGTAGTVKAAESVATGVPRDVLTRAATPEYAPRIEKAIAQIAETPNQPYLSLAQHTAQNLSARNTQVAKNITKSIEEFQKFQPNTRFNVAPKVPDIVRSLKSFEPSGLKVETRTATSISGKGKQTAHIVRSEQSPFSAREVELMQDLVDTMKKSDSVDVNNLLALRKKFGAAYDAVPLGVNGEPKPYHAAVMAMKEATEKVIDDLLPAQLKKANDEYRRFEDLKTAFGNRIIDSQGNLKDGAEQFISNLGNLNKGELRSKVEQYKDLTGVDLVDEIQVLKDAQKLSPLFATTGNRTQDIFRALIVGALGIGTGGPAGSAVALGLTSPRAVGKAATTVGKVKGKVRQFLGGMRSK